MDKPKENVETGLYTTAAMARFFGVSVQTVWKMIRDGIITPVEYEGTIKGQVFDLTEATQAYIAQLRGVASGRGKSADLEALTAQKLRADIALKEAQSELHEMKNEIAKGSFLDREEVKLDYGKFFLMFKKFALSIPSRVAGNISGRLEPVEVRAVEKDLQDEIVKLLNAFVVAGITEDEDKKPAIKLPKRGRPKKKK